jgi:hypothetical protein
MLQPLVPQQCIGWSGVAMWRNDAGSKAAGAHLEAGMCYVTCYSSAHASAVQCRHCTVFGCRWR